MISCNITYYNEPSWLKWWYDTVVLLNKNGLDVRLNIADDGSMVEPAEAFFDKHVPHPSMRLFRVKEDLGFNSHGARNLLMKQTETDWNVMSDIDRRYPIETFESIVAADLQRGCYYSFYEVTQSSPDRFSVNDYLVHRDDFWTTGGYDEEFVNIHWGDRYFLDALRYTTRRVTVPQWKVKYARKARTVTWADVPVTTYPDDNTLIHPNDRWPNQEFRFGLKDFVKERNKTHKGRMSKKVVNFEWVQLF